MHKFLKSVILYVLVLAMVIFPAITVCGENPECVFYDDFENGHVFWDLGSYQTMRISGGKLISDVMDSVCSASIKGEAAKWDNFVMDTVFETTPNNGWFGIYIRSGTDAQIHFVIHKNGFYTIPSQVSGSDGVYPFEDGKQYLIRITAQDTTITVQIKEVNETEFSYSWTRTYAKCAAGTIGFGSYLAKAKIDSVKISQQATQPVYFKNKSIAVEQGNTVSVLSGIAGDYDSISYSVSGNTFSVDQNGNVTASASGDGNGVLTLAAMKDGKQYTASCNLARTVPVTYLGYRNFYKMTVGETKNIKISISPQNATNKEIIWTVDNPAAIELVGDTESGIGIRALSPAKNVRILARSKSNPNVVYEEYITVEERPFEIKAQKFEPNGKVREIPYGMLGISMAMPINSAATREELVDYDTRHLPYMRDMKLQQLRMCFSHYDCTIGNIAGTNRNYRYTVEDIFRNANELDIPINITLDEYYDSAEKIITLANEIKKVTDKEICFGIWEECYDGRMANYSGWNVKTAKDYTDFLKEIYPEIKAEFPDGSVKIGATIIDYPSYLTFGNGSGTSMISTWNHEVAKAKDYFDAVAIHHYSQVDSTTQGMMEGFAVSASQLSDGIDVQTEMFEGKEFWMNEWGDLPTQVFNESMQSTSARNQYMKSLGSAINYLHRFLKMTENNAVTMAAYHVYKDSMGFGLLQKNGNTIHKMPAYHMFSMLGDVFEKNSHIYSLDYSEDDDLHYIKDMSAIHNQPTETYKAEVSLVNGWAFGDGNGMKEAVFENASEYYVKAYIPGYLLKKTMSYGNGENPLPDLAVNNGGKMTDLPVYIPEPQFYENSGAEEYILMPPYSICRTDLEKSELKWETVFEDDFSDGTLDKWTLPGEFENIGGAMAINVFNHTIEPKEKIAAENISVSFDLKDFITNMYVKFINDDNPEDYFIVTAQDKLVWDVTQATDGKHGNDPSGWHNFGRGISADGIKSIKYEIRDGVLIQYIKHADGTDFGKEHITGTYSYETPGHFIKKDTKYSVGFYTIGEQSSVEGYDKAKATIDNVKIEVVKDLISTPKIKPVYETVFEDDFSNVMSKWTGATSACRVTDETLLIDGFNVRITPDAVISSETVEIEFDVYGNPKFFNIEVYNTQNPYDRFYILLNDKKLYDTAEISSGTGIYHFFGNGIASDSWQTVKFRLSDGQIELLTKNSDEPEFIDRNHRRGIAYSSLWRDSDGKNVSLLKKGVKYGVRIYMYKYNEDAQSTQIDNFKVRTVPTEASRSIYIGGEKQFEISDISIKAKTAGGFELTSKPVWGTENKFIFMASGNNITGKAAVAVYDGNRLKNVSFADIKEVTEASAFVSEEIRNPHIKIMMWDDFDKLQPLTETWDYDLTGE